MSSLSFDYAKHEVWFMYNNGESAVNNSASFEDIRSQFRPLPSSSGKMFLHTHTTVMKHAMKWYLTKTIKQMTPMMKVELLNFHEINWDQKLVSLLALAMKFVRPSHTLAMYYCNFKSESLQATLFHRMVWWKPPFPVSIIFLDCRIGSKGAYCLQRSFRLHVCNRTSLNMALNHLTAISVKLLHDVKFRTGLKVLGCKGPVIENLGNFIAYLASN